MSPLNPGLTPGVGSPQHLERARIDEPLGERERAAAEYTAFVGLWKDSDPGL